MTRSKKRGRKRKRNPGWFQKGTDARRHIFTQSDCRVGWLVANRLHPALRDWLRMQLFVFYTSKRKEDRSGKKPNGRAGATPPQSAPKRHEPNGDHAPAGGCNADIPW